MRRPDQGHHLIQLIQGHSQPFKDMGSLLGFSQIKPGSPEDHILAMLDKMFQQFFNGKKLWTLVDHRKKNNTKARLHVGVLVELVDHHLGILIFF